MEIGQIKEAVKEVLEERLHAFYVERETHYQDHQFVRGLRLWVDGVKSTTVKTFVGIIVAAIVGLLALGFVMWGRKNIG